MSIINNKNLRLSDSIYTNDFSENVWIIERIKGGLSKYPVEFSEQFAQLSPYIQIIEGFMPYIACFSEVGDLLSQWRAYANGGNGVAIGFEVLIPRGIPNFYAGSDVKGNSLTLQQVIYDLNKQDAVLEKIFNCFLKNNDKHFVYGNELKSLSYIYKHPAFLEEKEWRIINSVLLANGNVVGANSPLYFSVANNGLISYLEMPIDEKSGLCKIKEVVLGPKNITQPNVLHCFLANNGFYNVKVSRSLVPYR